MKTYSLPWIISSAFWKDSLHELLAEQTKLYSMQKTDKSINTNKNEIKQFIGIQIYVSIIALPAY